MVIGIYGGGPAVEIWGTLAVSAALSVFCLNLAEYASAFPNAAGVTYAAARLGGPKYGRMAVRTSCLEPIDVGSSAYTELNSHTSAARFFRPPSPSYHRS